MMFFFAFFLSRLGGQVSSFLDQEMQQITSLAGTQVRVLPRLGLYQFLPVFCRSCAWPLSSVLQAVFSAG